MAVALDTVGSLTETGSIGSTQTYTGLVVPAGKLNAAYLFAVSIDGFAGTNPGTVTVTGLTGITQLVSQTNGADAVVQYWAALLGTSTSSTPSIVVSWTGTGTAFDIEMIGFLLTGVDQAAISSSFTNSNSFSATGTNPTLAITSTSNGLAFATFSTIASGDWGTGTASSTITVGGSGVGIGGSAGAGGTGSAWGDANHINWATGDTAGTGSSITFTGVESSSQANYGVGINVVAVVSTATLPPADWIMLVG